MHTTKPAYTQLNLNGFAIEDSTARAMAHLQKHEDQEARAHMFLFHIILMHGADARAYSQSLGV